MRLALALALTAIPALAFAKAQDEDDDEDVAGFECKGADCTPFRGPGPFGPGFTGASGGRIGLQLLDMTPELREFFGANKEVGVLVAKVVRDSPAAKAGLKVGDVVIRAGEDRIRSAFDLIRAIGEAEVGDLIKLTYVRGKSQSTVDVRVDRAQEGMRGFPAHPPMDRFLGGGEGKIERQLEKLRRRLDRIEEQLRR